MSREQALSADAKAQILDATGSESGTDSIMRSLERMGTDPSIEYFEMMQVAGARRAGGAALFAWRVRADRGHVEESEG
jgi:hypothetical protein